MKNNSGRNIWISCGVLILAACLCLGTVVTGGAGTLLWSSFQPGPTATPTRLPVTLWPTFTPTPGAESLTPAATLPAAELPQSISLQMDQIEQQVEALRGLQPLYSVPRYILSRDELAKVVEGDFFKDYTPDMARNDTLSLAAFGLIDPQTDLLDLYKQLYTEQIGGYYDNEKKAMYVIEGSQFLGTDRQTYAHEFDHALQDMYYNLDQHLQYNDTYCEDHSDACSAVEALVEGDASWVGNEWIVTYGTNQDIQDLLEFAGNFQSPVYDSAPLVLQQALMFPYQQGLAFIQALIDRGGPSAVDQAFANPPVSTEQILHPELYPDDLPQTVDLPDLSGVLGAGWRMADDDSLGESFTYLVLTASVDPQVRLPEEDARRASAGWDGDHYRVYVRDADQASILAAAFVWDSPQDAREFFSAMRTYGEARWGSPAETGSEQVTWSTDTQVSRISLNGDHTTWVITPDQATLDAVSTQIQP